MRLAVAYKDGQVFQHFGHTAQFLLLDAEDGRLLRREIVAAEGSGHGALAGFLREKGVGAVICGGHWRRCAPGAGPGGHSGVRLRPGGRGRGGAGMAGQQPGL